MILTIDHLIPVSILAQKEYQDLILVLLVHSSTTLLLLAMAFHVLHMKTTEYYPVPYVQSENEIQTAARFRLNTQNMIVGKVQTETDVETFITAVLLLESMHRITELRYNVIGNICLRTS